MKLTNQQIDALVEQEAQVFKEANKEKVNPVNKKLVVLANKYAKILKQIPEDVLDEFHYTRIANIDEDSFLKVLQNLDEEYVKPVVFDKNAYRNKILVASIDAKDLAELNSKLK